MTREEKLQKIYESIADKTISMGCIFLDDSSVEHIYDNKLPVGLIRKVIGHPVMIGDVLDRIENNIHKDDECPICKNRLNDMYCNVCEKDTQESEMFQAKRDLCIEWFYEYNIYGTINYDGIANQKRQYKRKPIDSQSEACIDYVLSIIKSVE